LLHNEGHHHHELVNALDKLFGAIDGIDDPDVGVLQAGSIVSRFFREPAGLRKSCQ
jgi:hypothetical protein